MVRLVVPYAPGAAIDVFARIVAKGMSEQFGQSVIVENRPGGLALIGAEAVAHSAPDGYTLLFTVDEVLTVLPHLSKKLPLDPTTTLNPVSEVGINYNILMVNPLLPVKTLPELLDYARAHPNELNFSTNSVGSDSQVAMEILKSKAGVNLVHVPYKGKAPALMAAVAGEVQFTLISYGTAMGLIKDNKLRPIVTVGATREPGLPDLPTTAELGYPEVENTTHFIVAAPSSAPPEVISKIHDAISVVLKRADTRSQIEKRFIFITNPPQEQVVEEIARRSRLFGAAVSASGISID